MACLFLLEAGLRITGAVAGFLQERRAGRGAEGPVDIRIMCVGESTTAGFYPGLLEEHLAISAPGVRFGVVNRGQPGADTSVIMASLDEDLERFGPHVVVAMMGANDHGGAIPWDGRPVASRTGLREDIKVWKLARYVLWGLVRESARRERALEGGLLLGGTSDLGQDPTFPVLDPVSRRAVKAAQAGRQDAAYGLHQRAVEETAYAPGASLSFSAFLHGQRRSREAVEVVRHAMDLHPGEPLLAAQLAFLLKRVGGPGEVEGALRRFVQDHPDSALAHMWLGKVLEEEGARVEAARHLERAVALDPSLDRGWMILERALRRSGRDDEVEAVLRRAMELNPESQILPGLMAQRLAREGRPGESAAFAALAREARNRSIPRMTIENHRDLHDRVRQAGALLVLLPYPFREPEPLLWMLQSTEGVLAVEHGGRFKAALAQHGYDGLFIDHCNGDSGHGTRLGDSILAASVADALLEAWRADHTLLPGQPPGAVTER